MCILCTCSKPQTNTQDPLKTLKDIQGEIDAIREQGRSLYAAEIKITEEMKAKRSEAESETILTQIGYRTNGIVASRLRYEIDTKLLKAVDARLSEIRQALKTLRKSKTPRPDDLSFYITIVEFEHYEKETREMLERNEQRIDFWKSEMAKWLESWKSGKLDYILPKPHGDIFRFHYDGKNKQLEKLKSLVPSIPKPDIDLKQEKAPENSP